MLETVRPQAVLPDRELCLTDGKPGCSRTRIDRLKANPKCKLFLTHTHTVAGTQCSHEFRADRPQPPAGELRSHDEHLGMKTEHSNAEHSNIYFFLGCDSWF